MGEGWNHGGRLFNPESPGGCGTSALLFIASAAALLVRAVVAVVNHA